jgi:hypothetical protein
MLPANRIFILALAFVAALDATKCALNFANSTISEFNISRG